MNSESKSKFNLWLSEHPESFLPSDEARMFDFVNSLYETEGNICIDEIFSGFTKSHPAYSKEEAMLIPAGLRMVNLLLPMRILM